jgi:hypothetical protein
MKLKTLRNGIYDNNFTSIIDIYFYDPRVDVNGSGKPSSHSIPPYLLARLGAYH